MRTATLVVAALLLLGGCLSGGPGAATATSPAPDESPTPSPTTTDEPTTEAGTATPACDVAPVSTVDPVRESVTPSPRPERPATLNASTVGEFVVAYEEAYRRNVGLTADTTTYEVDAWNPRVRAVDGGYVVNVTAVYWYNAADADHEGTGTPTVIHADGPEYTASYFVGADRLRVDTNIDDDTLAPREGQILECWPDS